MGSDFSAMGKAARAQIRVPELSIESIRERSHTAATRERTRALIVSLVIGLAVLGAGAAFGEKLYNGVRVWLSGGKVALVISSFTMVREPTAADLRSVVAHATFPVVLPVGLPAGTRVTMLQFAPADRPSFIIVEYQNKQANFSAGFSLFDTAGINPNFATVPAGAFQPSFRVVHQWRVGREAVQVPNISSQDASRIEAAMKRTSPADSYALTDAMLRRVIVLGGTSELADVAERYAPLVGRSILLDRRLIRRIPSLVQQGKPVVDDRTIYLSNIPTVHGEPDYSKATLRWPSVVAVPAAGVRAINAVLRYTGARGNCACRILFNQPDNTKYLIWTIPLSASAPVARYSVDAKTLVVTPSDGRQ